MSEEGLYVTSEILPFFEIDTKSKPQLDDKNLISKFSFTILDSDVGGNKVIKKEKDEDGDLILARKGIKQSNDIVITLEHSSSTQISLVGMQIWRAALLVADFIIASKKLFIGKTILELGSGVGLTSIVAGMFTKEVICTDLDIGNILKLIKLNIQRNKEIIKANINVCALDFFKTDWDAEFEKKLKEVDFVFAADVIYDNDVTEAFVTTITKILSIPPKKTLYLALEKRYVFTIADLDSVAPCYEHLLSCLLTAKSKPPFSDWRITEIALDFPQYFNYERTKHLIMYKIET